MTRFLSPIPRAARSPVCAVLGMPRRVTSHTRPLRAEACPTVAFARFLKHCGHRLVPYRVTRHAFGGVVDRVKCAPIFLPVSGAAVEVVKAGYWG